MLMVTPALPGPRPQRGGRTAFGLARRLCLALPMALLAGCNPPVADSAATAAAAPGSAPAVASIGGPVDAAPSAAPTPSLAPAPAARPEASTAAAPPASTAEAPPPSAAGAASPTAPLPPAVVAFQKQRDACDHFRGEEPYDKQRAAFLKTQLAKACKGSDRALAALRKRFAQDPGAIAALKSYEDSIE